MNVPGLVILNPISPGDDSKLFGTHYSHLGIGGFQEFETISERNAIPVTTSLHYDNKGSGRRRHLMLATVLDDGTGIRKTYQLYIPTWNTLNNAQKLTALADNNNWVEFGNDNEYIEQSFTNSSTITVNHNWDKYPVVTVVDTDEKEFIADVTYIDRNNVQIDFNMNKSGTVIVQGSFGTPPTGGGGGTSFQYDKTLFVSNNGDNLTASKGDINLPYQTIEEAYDNANNGDEIWIMSGLYQENTMTIDKDITFRLFDSIITPIGGQSGADSIFIGSTSGYVVKFLGKGKILNSGQYSDDTSAVILKDDFYCFENIEISSLKIGDTSESIVTFKDCIFSYQFYFEYDNLDKKVSIKNSLFYNCDFITEGGVGGIITIDNTNVEVNSLVLSDTRPFDVNDIKPIRLAGSTDYSANCKMKIKNCELYSYDNTIEISDLDFNGMVLLIDNSRFYSEDNSKYVIFDDQSAPTLIYKLINNISNVDINILIDNNLIVTGFIVDSEFELTQNNYNNAI